MSRLADRLAERIKVEFDFDCIPKITRTYAGKWQRTAGVGSWFMEVNPPKAHATVGSAFPATKVLNAKKLSISAWAGHFDYQINIEEL